MHKPIVVSIGAVLLATLLLAAPSHAAQGLRNFSGKEVESSDLKPFPKWTGALSRYFDQKQLSTEKCGSSKFNPCKLSQWNTKVESLRGASRRKQADEVNRYLNGVKYILDPVNWGTPDHWATPNEFLAVNGDCEDYAIAKFMSLRALGVPNEDMRIMIVQDMNLGGIIHGILALKLEGETYILDNQIPNMILASKIYHYKPVYSINETGWWRH